MPGVVEATIKKKHARFKPAPAGKNPKIVLDKFSGCVVK